MAKAPMLKMNNGLEIPVLGLGTWKSKPGEVATAVEHALKVGYRHLDCAMVYQNEKEVGAGIKAAMADGSLKREDFFVTSKLWNSFHEPEHVEGACKETLADLGLDYVDLYLVHWPMAFKGGEGLFPKNEDGTVKFSDLSPTTTWLAMEKLVEKGLVKSIGVSNFNSEQLKDVLDKGKIKPVTNQIECHPYLNQKKLMDFMKEKDIFVTAYSPLGSPDNPFKLPGEPNLLDDPKLVETSKKYGKSPAQIVLKWHIQRGTVPIPKSVTPTRITENLDVFDFTLNDEEMQHLDSFECNGRTVIPRKEDGSFRDNSHPHFPFNIPF